MLDEKDLQAIAALIQQSEQNIKLELRRDIIDSRNEIMAYIESKVERDIKTIAEGVSTLVAQRPKQEDVADLQDRVSTLEHVAKAHRDELDALKKAQ